MKSLLFGLSVLLVGCGTTTLPKPNTPKTAGVEALVTYGLAAHVANEYLVLPLCTSPLTVVPCKTAAIAAKLKAADNAAYAAAVAADSAANNTALQTAAQAKLDALKSVNTEANGGKQ